MAIVYKLDSDGGFTCGDTESRVTVYAYPTSPMASSAKRDPLATATVRLERENRASFRGSPLIVADYDARNWRVLGV